MKTRQKILSIDQVRTLLIAQAEKEAGVKFTQVLAMIPISNQYGTAYGSRKFTNFEIMYTGNPNYANASGTGGRGWYFKAYFMPGACSSIKIKNT